MKLISNALLTMPDIWPAPKWEMSMRVKVQLLDRLKNPMREYVKVDVLRLITLQIREDLEIK